MLCIRYNVVMNMKSRVLIGVAACMCLGCGNEHSSACCDRVLDSMRVAVVAVRDSARLVMEKQAAELAALKGEASALRDSMRLLREELVKRNRTVNGKPEFVRIPVRKPQGDPIKWGDKPNGH